MDEQPTNQQQLCDAFMSMWTEISAERFHHLNLCQEELKPERVHPGATKVYLIKWPVNVNAFN